MMSVEITLDTPLAHALSSAIQPKLVEVGLCPADSDATTLSDYILLMLVNGKSPDAVISELSSDALGLDPDVARAQAFTSWLFDHIAQLHAQHSAPQPDPADATVAPQDVNMDMDNDTQVPTSSGAEGSASDLNVPTGPRAMRNSPAVRPGREKRIVGHINRAMDRSHDSLLHRVRAGSGNERISRHPPAGPKMMNNGRPLRTPTARAASIAQGVVAMGGPMALQNGMTGVDRMNGRNGASGMNPTNNWPMAAEPHQQVMNIYAIFEQQSRIMQQMHEQMMHTTNRPPNRGGFMHGHNKPPFDQRGHNGGSFKQGGYFKKHQNHTGPSDQFDATKADDGSLAANSDDVDMTLHELPERPDPPNPDETMCKYNLRCANPDCKFVHQSPAAPPGTTIDFKDTCAFGAACKNRKCVGRHPSAATRLAHQSDQDCKYFPNCTNPTCPFRHPSAPPCWNGADCKVPNCKFTHIKAPCKYHPCTNRYCPFAHEEGQRGTFHDKVWKAGGEGKKYVSERKFVDDSVPEDLVIPE